MIGLRQAFRSSLKVDLRLIAPVTGAVTAFPVIAIFAVGLAVGNNRAAISMAIGANLVAIASLVGAPRLPVRLAIFDALALGISVFVGTVTGPYAWLHIAVLIPWCFGAGMLVALGPIESVIGTHAIIAFVVLGRFAGSPLEAVHLGLLAMVGALVEILALLVLRLPPSLRYQRRQLADAFDSLATLTERDPTVATSDVALELDRCEQIVSAATLFDRTDAQDLRSILDQAQRMRLELTTVAGLRARLSSEDASYARTAIDTALKDAGAALVAIGAELRRERRSVNWRSASAQYQTALRSLDDGFGRGNLETEIIALQSVGYLAGLGGQIRAAGNLVDGLGSEDRRSAWHPHVSTPQRSNLRGLAADLSLLRDNIQVESAAFRHAVRLSISVSLSFLIATWLSLPRAYWLPYSVAVILRPTYGSLFGKGLSRVVGTLLGATLGAVMVSELHPGLVLTTVLVALTAWAAYSTWSASFSVAIGFITALILILLNTSLNDTVTTALDRFIDIALGGAIAIVVYLVWPTSPKTNVSQALARLYAALADYLGLVLALMERKPVEATQLEAKSKTARRAWTNTEDTISMSLLEPQNSRIDPSEAQGLIAVALRIVRAIHAMRIEAERGATVITFDEFERLGAGLVSALQILADWFSHHSPARVPDLRLLYRTMEHPLSESGALPSVAVHLDELVNAIDTAVLIAGLKTTVND